MIVIYRTTDRIPIEIGDIKIWVSPLSIEHKMKIASLTKVSNGKEEPDPMAIAVHTLRYSLKDIDGVQTIDGDKYKLEFNSDGSLKDDCLSDILNMMNNEKLVAACISVATQQKLSQPIEGVRILSPESKKKTSDNPQSLSA